MVMLNVELVFGDIARCLLSFFRTRCFPYCHPWNQLYRKARRYLRFAFRFLSIRMRRFFFHRSAIG